MKRSSRIKWALILGLSAVQLLYYLSYFSLDYLKFFLADPAAYTYQIIFKNQGVFQGFWLLWITETHLVSLTLFFVLALWNVFRRPPSNLNWPGLLITGVLIFWPVFFNFVVFPIVFVTGMDCLWNPDCL
jgi:hypothetical protein